MKIMYLLIGLFLYITPMAAPAYAGVMGNGQSSATSVSTYCATHYSAPQCQPPGPNMNAANQAPDGVPNVLDTSQTTVNTSSLLSVVRGAITVGETMAARFIPYAMGLTAILGAITLTFLGIMILLSQADVWHMGLRPIFITIFTIGLTIFFLKAYSYLTTAVVDGFLFAADILVGGSGSNGPIATVMNAFQNDFFAQLHMLSTLISKISFSGGLWNEVEQFFMILGNFIIDLFSIAFATLILGLLYVVFLVLYLLYQFVVAIAIAVGPVFIPFLAMPATKSLFEGWLKMLIMSGIYLMTSTVIVGLVGTSLDTYIAQFTVPSSGIVLNAGLYIEMCILDLVSILALFKTHEFAHAIGGNVSLGGMNIAGTAVKVAAKGLA